MYSNIPHELRTYNQWVVWRYEESDGEKPTKVPYNVRNNRLASVTDPNTWATYDECVAALGSGLYSGLGFVLTEYDPFAFVDLDDTKGDQAAFDRQLKIYNEFVSYAELSPSGSGLHIIVRGKLKSGRRRGKIEIYSNQRFMTMTGNVNRPMGIMDCDALLNALYDQMGNGAVNAGVYVGQAEQTSTDDEIFDIAATAANGEKFVDLWEGEYEKYYESQSEADFALVDIIAYYTQNRAQIMRMFRASALGQREKAQRVDYMGHMLNRCFDNLLPPVDIDGLRNRLEEILAERELENPSPIPVSEDSSAEPIEIIEAAPTVTMTPERAAYTPPPGLMGELAQFIYAQAPRPVPEIALIGAMGLMAGIVGRAYNISGTGLNGYFLLLAPTGTGKEAIARGVSKLFTSISTVCPSARDFVGPGEVASSQALTKFMAKGRNSFVSVVGEFGMYLQQMGAENAPPHLVQLRRLMLDLYNKSGEGDILGQTIYSDSEKNTASVASPNFNLVGESTPEKFYEGLHEGMISEGLLPRFTIVEYHGDRPPFNKNHDKIMPNFGLIDRFAKLCANALMLNSQHKVIHVKQNPQATDIFESFDKFCDSMINNAAREVVRHLWNRAHIKALKLAATVAVGCNSIDPVIDENIANWAINLVVFDVENMLKRFNQGDIGNGNDETKQLLKVCATIKDYILTPWSEVKSYAGDNASKLHAERVVPYSYIHRRLSSVAVFRKDRQGATQALKRAMRTLVERGDLAEVARSTMAKDYGTNAVAYMIANPKAIGI